MPPAGPTVALDRTTRPAVTRSTPRSSCAPRSCGNRRQCAPTQPRRSPWDLRLSEEAAWLGGEEDSVASRQKNSGRAPMASRARSSDRLAPSQIAQAKSPTRRRRIPRPSAHRRTSRDRSRRPSAKARRRRARSISSRRLSSRPSNAATTASRTVPAESRPSSQRPKTTSPSRCALGRRPVATRAASSPQRAFYVRRRPIAAQKRAPAIAMVGVLLMRRDARRCSLAFNSRAPVSTLSNVTITPSGSMAPGMGRKPRAR